MTTQTWSYVNLKTIEQHLFASQAYLNQFGDLKQPEAFITTPNFKHGR